MNTIKTLTHLLYLLVFSVCLSAFSQERPNIIVILSDDMGYSDLGCYGGDADTPNLDSLAQKGLRFTQFYNSARCMPTRAALLTGLHPHQAGIGHMATNYGLASYSGHLLKSTVTLGEVMQQAGYHTSMLGKWHVGKHHGATPDKRGFERSWVRNAKVDYFKHDIYDLDGKKWVCPEPKSFYSTEEMDRKAIEFIKDAKQQKKPFFMYAAYDAAHWPLHAKEEDIAKYKGRFLAEGWTNMRQNRYQRQIATGVIDPKWALSPNEVSVPQWKHIKDKELWDLKMSIYCAQIDSMDRSIGRIMKYLKQENIFDNTLIMYMQDNGACAEGIGMNGKKSKIKPGPAGSYMAYHMPWANVSTTPFKSYKHFTKEGGIATPLIAHWPKGIKQAGKVTSQVGHVIDILPTCIELAGVTYPKEYKNNKITPVEGLSLLPIFTDGQRKGHKVLCWEHEGNRAVRSGKWKLVSRYKYDFKLYKQWGFSQLPRTKEWELYNMDEDRTELNDVSSSNLDVVENLKNSYKEWAKKVNAVPYEELIKMPVINKKKK